GAWVRSGSPALGSFGEGAPGSFGEPGPGRGRVRSGSRTAGAWVRSGRLVVNTVVISVGVSGRHGRGDAPTTPSEATARPPTASRRRHRTGGGGAPTPSVRSPSPGR